MPKTLAIIKRILLFSVKLCAVLIVMGLVIGATTWITIQVLINRDEVVVPDLKGKDLRQATFMLDQLGLRLSIAEGKGEYSDDVAFDHIVTQDPLAGTSLKTDRRVKVVLSLGSGNLDIPDLRAQATQKARVLLQERGLTLGRIARIHTDQYPPNTVISQDPPAGSSTSSEKEVDILESLGPADTYYLMPDFTYYNYHSVVDFFARFNIKVRTEYRYYEGIRDGVVIKTKPHPGYPLRQSDIVSIYVSKSVDLPERTPTPPYSGKRRYYWEN